MLIRSTHISLQPTILTLLLIHLVMMILGDFFLLPLAASNEY
ncbi:rhomboid family intramembrane serine protease, partial [Klebsiella pneumoniae]|nr:rhomboid family intramembrane serine protease [Klebsiella pneumoniae]